MIPTITEDIRETNNLRAATRCAKIEESSQTRAVQVDTGGSEGAVNPLRDAAEVLNRDFLDTRCRILDVAAALDRLDRARGRAGDPPDRRLAQLRQALEALLEPGPGRAETVQRIFSLEYDPQWRMKSGLAPNRSR